MPHVHVSWTVGGSGRTRRERMQTKGEQTPHSKARGLGMEPATRNLLSVSTNHCLDECEATVAREKLPSGEKTPQASLVL